MLRKTAVFLSLLAAAAAVPALAQAQGTLPGGYPFGAFPNLALGNDTTRVPQVSPSTTPFITNAPAAAPSPTSGTARSQPGDALRPGGPAAAEPQREERNEFQDFVEASTGRRLPVFGHELFRGVPSTFAPVENIPVTPDYVVGPGDELYIRAWGQIDIDYRATVDRNGTINIPRVGVLNVAAIKYQDLTAYLKNAVSRNFRNFDLTVTLGNLRSIQVFVVGQARRPGAYTVSSLSTLVNAIFAAGGPSVRGSMRAIQLKRANRALTELDLYDLLLKGDKSRDAALLPGDVIYVPPVGPLAAVAGSVNHPAIFELKGATPLGELLGYAGGLSTVARASQVTLERIDERKTRVVQQFDYGPQAAHRAMKDGDLVSVLAILPKFENAVTLRGNVATPLRHPYQPGMRIRDLIPDKEALITPEYYRRKNQALRPAVTQERLTADVRRLADEINWDYAVIERLDRTDLSTSLIPFDLGKAVLENDPANNLPLAPGDIVTVFSKSDVSAPAEKRAVVVSLEGEFNFAGVYQARPGETLRQLVARLGGVTGQAYLFGASFTRESVRANQEERLGQALAQLEQDVERAAVSRAQSVVAPEDAAALKQEAEAQRRLIERLRTLRPIGRIVLQLPANAAVADLPDIALEDGDRLQIPPRPSMVSVFGTVFNEASFLYTPERTLEDYLALAGGPRKEADKKSIYVLRANGSVLSQRQSGFMLSSLDGSRLSPGDAIVVPEDFERTTLTKDLKDWTQIFYQFGLGAAALKVIRD